MSKSLKLFLGISYIIILFFFLYLILSNVEVTRLDDFLYYKEIQMNLEKMIGGNLYLNLIIFFIFSLIWISLLGFGSPLLITSGVLFDSVEYKISIDLMEEIEYENKEDLLWLDRWWIENNECVNKQIPIREEGEALKEWYKKPESKIICRERDERFRENNREKLRLQQKELRDKQKKDNTSNYEKTKQKRKEIIICECSCKTTKGTLNRHRKSKKHIKLMETENIII